MSETTARMQRSTESLRKMLEILEPYLPKREFEADPPAKQWEQTRNVKQKADEESLAGTMKVHSVY